MASLLKTEYVAHVKSTRDRKVRELLERKRSARREKRGRGVLHVLVCKGEGLFEADGGIAALTLQLHLDGGAGRVALRRSEERRGGEECRG